MRACIEAHDGQLRKGSNAPYSVHPTHMALLLARAGASDTAIEAALLHDTVEDCQDWTHERVSDEFGPEVAAIVDALTEDKSLTWPERKQAAVDHVPAMSDEAALVKAADKLHNLTSLLTALEASADREEVWSHFKGGREETLRLSEALVSALAPRIPGPIAQGLRQVLDRLNQLY